MLRRAPFLGFALATLVTAVGLGQTSQIAGQVTDAKSHAPLPGVVVALNGRGGPPPARVITDAEGRFAFPNVPQGNFSVVATRNGYFGNGDGRDPAGPGRVVEVASGQAVPDVSLALWKLGAISGSVAGDGDPLVGIEVMALRRSLIASRWR